MKRMKLVLFCAAVLSSGFAMSADLAAGAAKAQTCAPCHGPAGISQMAGTPSLAGQPDGFLQWQLVFFRAGTRKNPLMQPMAATLKDDDIRNLAAYFAAQPPPRADAQSKADEALAAAGRKVAQGNRCTSCHKDDFSGTQATPRVAAQREDYLLKALRDFKSGQRVGGGVAAMADVVYPLTDDDLRALAHYLSHLPS